MLLWIVLPIWADLTAARMNKSEVQGEMKMIEGKLHLMTVEGTGRRFQAQSGSGHTLVMDDAQGNTGPKPIEAALLALGGCTAFDVISILRKKRQQVTGYEITLNARQNPEPPNYFTHVEIRHHLRGEIDPEAVRQALHLSETKYCSVGAMISKTAKIENTFEIVKEDVAVAAAVSA
jgi:putative redox protein